MLTLSSMATLTLLGCAFLSVIVYLWVIAHGGVCLISYKFLFLVLGYLILLGICRFLLGCV